MFVTDHECYLKMSLHDKSWWNQWDTITQYRIRVLGLYWHPISNLTHLSTQYNEICKHKLWYLSLVLYVNPQNNSQIRYTICAKYMYTWSIRFIAKSALFVSDQKLRPAGPEQQRQYISQTSCNAKDRLSLQQTFEFTMPEDIFQRCVHSFLQKFGVRWHFTEGNIDQNIQWHVAFFRLLLTRITFIISPWPCTMHAAQKRKEILFMFQNISTFTFSYFK